MVTAKVIERLKEHDEISNWVIKGLELNEKYKNEVCEFCGNILSEVRIKQLEEHFNDEVSKIKKELESLLNDLRQYYIKQEEIIIDKSLFYKENNTNIEKLNKNIIEEILKLNEFMKLIEEKIEEKKNNPFKIIEIDEIEKIIEIFNKYNEYVTIQEQYVEETNNKTMNFEKQTKEVETKLARYYLKNEFQTEDIIDRRREYIKDKNKVDKMQQNLEDKEHRLNELESTLSNESLRAEKFNEKLNVF